MVPEIYYTVPEIWHMIDVIFFKFWAILCPFTPLTAQKIRILKKKKCLESWWLWSRCTIPEIWCMRDGWKKWPPILVGAPPKNRGVWYIEHLEQIFSFRCVLFTCLNSFWCAIVCDCRKLFTLFLSFTLHVHWTWFKIVLYRLNVIQGHISQNNITEWHKMFFKGHNARLLSKHFYLQPFFLKDSVSLLFA